MPRFLVILIVGLGLLLPVEASAQAPSPSGTGLAPNLPIVPVPLRDLPSTEVLPPQPREDMSKFLKSATKSDAVLEVILGQARILTMQAPIAIAGQTALVASGDPSVIEFSVEGDRMLRVLGRRVGVTDLSITTDAGQTNTFEVHVLYDLPLMTAYLQQIYPDATIELKQLREHIVLQGQARSVEQISKIVETLGYYVASVNGNTAAGNSNLSPGKQLPYGTPEQQAGAPDQISFSDESTSDDRTSVPSQESSVSQEEQDETSATMLNEIVRPDAPVRLRRSNITDARIINLMRVPGVQQVMLKVQIAELNRTALRQIGADIFIHDGRTTLGTFIAGAAQSPLGIVESGPGTTAFGLFDNGDVQIFLSALRSNGIANILAEPNLLAMNGQEASFLAGGEFPVPVPQNGVSNAITVEFKEFGVLLNFVPTILDDETIRLRVAPEVSNLDFATQINVLGTQVPGLAVRRVNTTVELKQGQTLALAGLLQVSLDADTDRIPGLGDLPYLGPLFSNTTHQRVEKEMLVMVTPYLVSPMEACQVPPMPGSEILDPNDCEFYFLNRLEGRTGTPFRSTDSWDDPCGWRYRMNLEHREFCGPVGYSE